MTQEKHDKDTDFNRDFYCKSIVYKGVFTATDRVNCLLPINGGEHLLIGAYSGVYLIDQRPSNDNIEPWRILLTFGVTQLDILEEHRLFMVLSNGTLNTYPLEVLTNAIEHEEYVVCRPWKIQDNVRFTEKLPSTFTRYTA
ncbi:hypothetical protein ABOM_012112 [Aspergillus bombycis]|uniref:CNH domain-containing protein n=1 Tax=Aspergillus bombycis TaxID=109264 RepID=A0A1F7ZIY7_9EURO|nr:hypothetical protein ABOM_012112 [Aspergillus bombycis]OGM39416.1 hypothetical protein ABOM_012112 [Aspergillus bombycis]